MSNLGRSILGTLGDAILSMATVSAGAVPHYKRLDNCDNVPISEESWFVYSLQGPLDHWYGWEYVSEMMMSEYDFIIGPWFHAFLALKHSGLGWEGDGRWRVMCLPVNCDCDGEPLFAIKQSNNGSTFVVTQTPLEHLRDMEDEKYGYKNWKVIGVRQHFNWNKGVQMNEQNVFRIIRLLADNCFDGHFTVMKFTTNWRVQFGSQDFCADTGAREMKDGKHAQDNNIEKLPCGSTLLEAFVKAVESAEWPDRPERSIKAV